MARARVPAPRLSRPVAPAPAAATTVRRAPRASVPPVGPLLRWSFLAFVFSIPFEAADIGQPSTDALLWDNPSPIIWWGKRTVIS